MASGDDDEQLARRFVAGDTTAFDELTLRHRDVVYRFVRAHLGVLREEAEDVTQDVLIAVYRGLPGFAGRSRLLTWILGVAFNVCRQRRRSGLWRAKREVAGDTGELHELPAGGAAEIEDLIGRRRLQQAVRTAIADLCPEHRVTVLLRDVEGLSYGEIAEVLRVPLGTVRSRLHNARALLAKRLLPLAQVEGC